MCTGANAISDIKMKVIICPGSGVFKTYAGNMPFRAIIGRGKKKVSKHFLQWFCVTKCFYAVIAIKHDSDTFTSAGSLGRC